MRHGLELGLSQSLTMTPQLQQAIRLLQLSTVELELEVREALEANPMLEVDEEAEAARANSTVPMEASSDAPDAPNAEAALDMDTRDTEIPSELAVDGNWEDTYMDLAPSGPARDDDDTSDYGTLSSRPQTLQDHLEWQLGLTHFTDSDRILAELIVDAVRPDGYLGAQLDELLAAGQETLGRPVETDEILAVLHRVQRFDPPGIAARDVAECLSLQLQQLPETPQRVDAQRVVQHLTLLAAGDYRALTRATGLKDEALAQAIALVRSLNPRPGSGYDQSEPEYVIPDVLVRKVNGVWEVELNPAVAPKLRINRGYADLIRRRDGGADNTYLRTRLAEARWFINSLKSRHETLLNVARCIVRRQLGFFERGAQGMVPMVLQDVADELEMHQSTVSRVTTKKYLHTPQATYELKYFFSSHVRTSDGGMASATAIRSLISELIAAESAPLSDSQITDLLQQRGIEVARRTVAKYRESLNIPPSSERRRPMMPARS